MVISHEHRYVYVEVPRTGSSAIARELREHYGGEQILRKHATYRDFLRHATEDERSYFTFSGVRNPLDVAVTRYVHIKQNAKDHFTDPHHVSIRNSLASRLERRIYAWVKEKDADFETFLKRWYLLPWDTWTSLDHRGMDMIIRFENLADDFAVAIARIGLEPVRPLPVVNATPGKDGDFTSYDTPATRKRAAWVFGPYIEVWGYSFPPEWGRVRVPWWSRLLYRAARAVRGVYWRYLRFDDYVKKGRRYLANTGT